MISLENNGHNLKQLTEMVPWLKRLDHFPWFTNIKNLCTWSYMRVIQ